MKYGIFGAAAIALMLPSFAAAKDERGLFGLTPDDFARGSAVQSADSHVAAAVIASGTATGIQFSGFSLRGDSMILEADRVVVSPGGQVNVIRGTVKSKHDGKGILSFQDGSFESAVLLETLMLEDSCTPFGAASPDQMDLGDAEFADLVLRAPEDVMDAVAAGTSSNGPEVIRIKRLSMSFTGLTDAPCFMVSRLSAHEGVAVAADGSIGRVSRAEGRANFLPGSGQPVFLDASMTGAVAYGPDGDELLLAENVAYGFSIDEGITAGLQALAETDPEEVVPNIVQLLADGNFGFHYTASGLRIPLGEMLSNSQRDRIGSNGSEVVTGAAAMSLSSKADRIRLVANTDLEGMQDAHLDLEMVITPGAGGGTAMAMTGGHPAAVILPYLQIEGLEFSIEDRGIWQLIERGTGKPVSAHAAGLAGLAAMAPSEISKPVMEWINGIARNGRGGVTMNPIEPVGLVEVMMGAMMNPGGLGSLLSIETH